MNTGRVRESIGTHNGFVRLNRHIAKLAHHLADTMNFLGINSCVYTEECLAGFNRHDHFFQCSVASTFADAVDGTFNLARAVLYGG